MEEIMTVPMGLITEAKKVSVMRSRMKAYLADFGECYDKFTVTENDTFLGYVSEQAIIEYLAGRYGGKLEIKKWSDCFDMKRILAAVETKDGRRMRWLMSKTIFTINTIWKLWKESRENLFLLMLKLLKQVSNRKIHGTSFIL